MQKDYIHSNKMNTLNIHSQKNLLNHMKMNRSSKENMKLYEANDLTKYGNEMNLEYNNEIKEIYPEKSPHDSVNSIDFKDTFAFEKLSLCFYSSKSKKNFYSKSRYNLI